MAGCAIFDVIDTLFIYNSYGLFRYGFFIFISISTYSLAERFDSLLTQLDASNTALDEANMALEATVKERTRELEQKARELEEQARLAEEASDAATLASKAKSEFLAHMSHEIRTPMNAILGLLELIQRKELPPDVREHAMVMKTAGGNLLSIINDILDFSKIESGKLEIVPAKYSLASLINDAVSITRARLANKPLLFTVDVSSALPVSLVGDEARLRQILINLLSNALKYTREGHFSLRVDGEPRGDGMFALRFEVSDTGIGIRKDDIGKLFRDFTQLDASRHKSVEGTGLGLAITRNLCVAMEGSIDVQSEYGKGSRFTAVIPQAADGDCSGGSCLASVQAREGKNILVLDDRPVCARSIANALNSLGVSYRLVSAVAEFSAALAAAGGDSAVGDTGDAAGDAPSAVGAGTMAGDGSAAGDGEEHRPFSHLFVASAFAEEARRASDEQFARDSAERPGRRPAFVTLANPADAANAANGDVLEMPAHAISIANLLNDASGHSAGPEAPGGEADGSDPQFTAAGARVLIVDDIDINLFVMEGLLEPYEIKADVCLSGKEAIELARENRYDIIFMDHMMPEMDGIEATAAIRTLGGAGAGAIPEPAPADAFAASPDSPGGEYYSTLPIVALTANAVVGQREVFLQNGMSDFLAKPIELHKLNAILRKWLPKEKQA
jgi:signal transduction histidine kinase/CheY-like chemotaxis protein